jgi:hypothetical protein
VIVYAALGPCVSLAVYAAPRKFLLGEGSFGLCDLVAAGLDRLLCVAVHFVSCDMHCCQANDQQQSTLLCLLLGCMHRASHCVHQCYCMRLQRSTHQALPGNCGWCCGRCVGHLSFPPKCCTLEQGVIGCCITYRC